MLEKMAEMVREDAESNNDSVIIPCAACKYLVVGGTLNCSRYNNEGITSCPDVDSSDGSLMFARWAVLLVARALEKWVAEIDRTNGVDLSDVEALGSEFMDLYYEVKKAEAKEAAECQSAESASSTSSS